MSTFASGGLGGLIERGVAGKAGDIGGALYGLRQASIDQYGYGRDLSEEGVGGVRRLGDAYERTLGSGRSVLPDSTLSVLKRARGQISDRNVRDTMASAARLRQARIGSGGKLSAEAAQEYQTESEIEANRAAQDADFSLSAEEAGMELKETNTLRDRLSDARKTLLGAGQFQQDLGQRGQLSAMALSLERNKAISQEARAWVSMFKPSGGFTP